MEPNNFDELARQAVQGAEQNTSLDPDQANTLWAQIGAKPPKTYVAWWRAAAVLLFLLSASLLWYGQDYRFEYRDALLKLNASQAQKQAVEMALAKVEQRAPVIEEVVPLPVPEVKTVVIRDTVFQVQEVERIVFVDREILVTPTLNSDSLLAIIQMQEESLKQFESFAMMDDSKAYLNSFNAVFEDPQVETTQRPQSQKKQSIKFKMSLFNK